LIFLLLPRTATRSSPTEPLTPLNQITAAPIHFSISLFLGPNQPPHGSPHFLANNTEPLPFDFLLPQPPDASLPSTLSIVFSSKNGDWLLPPRPLISFSP
jgi:hypothetical protein